jgi:hypothetical protein
MELPAETITLTIGFVDILVFFQSGGVGGFRNGRQIELGGWHTSMVAAKKRVIVSNVSRNTQNSVCLPSIVEEPALKSTD